MSANTKNWMLRGLCLAFLVPSALLGAAEQEGTAKFSGKQVLYYKVPLLGDESLDELKDGYEKDMAALKAKQAKVQKAAKPNVYSAELASLADEGFSRTLQLYHSYATALENSVAPDEKAGDEPQADQQGPAAELTPKGEFGPEWEQEFSIKMRLAQEHIRRLLLQMEVAVALPAAHDWSLPSLETYTAKAEEAIRKNTWFMVDKKVRKMQKRYKSAYGIATQIRQERAELHKLVAAYVATHRATLEQLKPNAPGVNQVEFAFIKDTLTTLQKYLQLANQTNHHLAGLTEKELKICTDMINHEAANVEPLSFSVNMDMQERVID